MFASISSHFHLNRPLGGLIRKNVYMRITLQEMSGMDSLRSQIDKISESLREDIQDFKNQVNDPNNPVNTTAWHSLPPPAPQMPVVAAVDGGSRSLNTRGSKILFAQAAGRIMGDGMQNRPWHVSRRSKLVTDDLADDLLSLLRQRLEIAVCTEILRNDTPRYLLLDGTLETLFRVGVPSRISAALDDNKKIPEGVSEYYDEIVKYGETLTDFLSSVKKTGAIILGVPKDNYTRRFIPADSIFTDTTFFSAVSNYLAGYSDVKEIKTLQYLKNSVLGIWKSKGHLLPEGFGKIKSFYCSVKDKGTPIRIDQFSSSFIRQDELLSDLLTLTDGRDWFIPPRLAHERAVVKNDIFDAIYQGVFNSVSDYSPRYANLILSRSRRSRTQ